MLHYMIWYFENAWLEPKLMSVSKSKSVSNNKDLRERRGEVDVPFFPKIIIIIIINNFKLLEVSSLFPNIILNPVGPKLMAFKFLSDFKSK